mmetsp:Transcript_26966/g.85701  ORF Transcript_26966/g.85701 Transcript_26966/m.85701 type:complete len:205 (+) Transcript_26966:191-805(+)
MSVRTVRSYSSMPAWRALCCTWTLFGGEVMLSRSRCRMASGSGKSCASCGPLSSLSLTAESTAPGVLATGNAAAGPLGPPLGPPPDRAAAATAAFTAMPLYAMAAPTSPCCHCASARSPSSSRRRRLFSSAAAAAAAASAALLASASASASGSACKSAARCCCVGSRVCAAWRSASGSPPLASLLGRWPAVARPHSSRCPPRAA